MRLKFLIGIICSLLTLASCKKEEVVKEDPRVTAQKEKQALHVAVFPCEACMPIYYAHSAGIFDSLGVDVRLLQLSTMEDCDTALIHHRAELTTSDIARLICMRKDGFKATAIAQMPGSMYLLTAKAKKNRIYTAKQLAERLVAMDRHSEADYYSDKVFEEAGMDLLDIFRTQFNNHRLRYDMLRNGLVEAAFLDQPYAAMAVKKGAYCMWERSDNDLTWTVLALATETLNNEKRMKQIKSFIEGYQKAVEMLNDKQMPEVTADILKRCYELPVMAVDTLPFLKPGFEMNDKMAIAEDEEDNNVEEKPDNYKEEKQDKNTKQNQDSTKKSKSPNKQKKAKDSAPAKKGLDVRYHLKPLRSVNDQTIQQVKTWLIKREWIDNKVPTDSLSSDKIL